MSPRRLRWAGALLGVSLLAHAPALQAGFIWDDDYYVTANQTLHSGARGLAAIWMSPGATPQYYPVTFTSFWIEHQLWGDAPAGYHLINLLLHAGSAVLLWELLVQLRLGANVAWLAAAAFAVHPVTVESVAWVTERKNVLSLLLALATALLVLRSLPLEDESARPRVVPYLGALAVFAAALLSKTVVATLPASLLVLRWWRGRLRWRDVVPMLPFFALGLGLGLVTAHLERTLVGAAPTSELSGVNRLLLAGSVPWFYAGKLLLPWRLCFVYPRWDLDGSPRYWLALLACVALLAGLWAGRRRLGRGPLSAVLIFGGTLFPAMGFFDVYPFRFSWVADHFQYHAAPALVTLCVAGLALGVRRLPGPWPGRLSGALAALLIVVLGAASFVRARQFHSAESLWRDTLAKNPRSAMAHTNLGVLLMRTGHLQEAQEQFRDAAALEPGEASYQANLAMVAFRLGRPQEAQARFEEALRLDPQRAEILLNYAALLVALGRPAQAVAPLQHALELRPLRLDWRVRYASLLANLGRVAEARRELERTLEQDPAYGPALQLRGQLGE